jgi:ABC-type phosphate transport system substrate-binding protein
MRPRKRTWFLVRIAAYIAVIAVLFAARGGDAWRRLAAMLQAPDPTAGTLTVAGGDLAPRLLDRLLVAYGRDYPQVTITREGGGTNQALEALLHGTADVALLFRPPTPVEQGYFRIADGDTAIVVPVAVGGALLLAREAAVPDAAPTPADLRRLVDGGGPGDIARLYASDPNDGLWDAVRSLLGLTEPDSAALDVVFLADAAAIEAAVAADAESWGLVSSLAAPGDPLAGPPAGLAYVPLRAAADSAAAAPTYENLATGAYPLHHVLYAASRADGSIEGAKFMTYLASAPGQRQVERAGVVPVRHFAREIYLSRDPVGR